MPRRDKECTPRTEPGSFPPRAIPLRQENAAIVRSLWNISIEELKSWGDRGCPAIKRLPSESAHGTRLVAIVAGVDAWLASLSSSASMTPTSEFRPITATTSTVATTGAVPLPRGRVTRELTDVSTPAEKMIADGKQGG